MVGSVGAAARLPDSERMNLAILALARSATVSDLAIGHGVSRTIVYAQTPSTLTKTDPRLLTKSDAASAHGFVVC